MSARKLIPTDIDIGRVLSEASKQEDHQYATAFRAQQQKGDSEKWFLLAQIFDFHFTAGNASQPFGPMLVMDGKRSMIPSDLTNEQLTELNSTLETVSNPEFQARIADVIWLCKRDANAARLAVKAYVASATNLEDPNHWTQSMERYERALRLARQIEPKGELPKQVLAHLDQRVRHYKGEDPLYFTLKALELLDEFSFGNAEELASIAGKVAIRSGSTGDFRKAREHYDIQARFLKRAGKSGEAEASRVEAAESFVKEAEAREAEGSFMAARVFWEEAVRAFRDRPSLRPSILSLQKRLSIAGEKTLEELKRHSVELDLTQQAEASKAAVAGLALDEAFFKFAVLLPLLQPEKLRQEAEEMIKDHPLQATLDMTIFDAAGRKVGIRPSAFTDDPQQREAATIGFMEQSARFYRGPTAVGSLAPAMHQILAEHEIDQPAIENLIGDSPVIPEGRKPLFIQSIMAGFRWDFCTALHLLVPQIENALRHVLAKNGVTPTNVDANGIEEVWSFERILSHPNTQQFFGPALTYELRSLLTERLGANFRNLLAHGLLSKEALDSDTALYLWWVLLRILVVPSPKFKDFVERQQLIRQSTGA
jgi:hypothetical protein